MRQHGGKKQGKAGLLFLYIILLFFAFLFLFPLCWNFLSALGAAGREGTEDTAAISNRPPSPSPGGKPGDTTTVQDQPLRGSFGDKLRTGMRELNHQLPHFWLNAFNTIFVSALAASTQVFFCTMAGFAFARYDFKGRKLLFRLILIIPAIPPIVNIIPFFRMMVFFRWTNTYLPLFIPCMANAFGIFYMTQFIKQGLPRYLLDIARTEGLGEMQILLNICFPLVRPGLALLGVIAFIYTWNEFVVARVMLYERSAYTLSVALSALNIGPGKDFGVSMLANMLNILPLLVLFLIFSGKFFRNFEIVDMINREPGDE